MRSFRREPFRGSHLSCCLKCSRGELYFANFFFFFPYPRFEPTELSSQGHANFDLIIYLTFKKKLRKKKSKANSRHLKHDDANLWDTTFPHIHLALHGGNYDIPAYSSCIAWRKFLSSYMIGYGAIHIFNLPPL